MHAESFLSHVIGDADTISPAVLADRLHITRGELAGVLGLSRDAVSKTARTEARRTQTRLRDMVEILNRVLPWSGSELGAYAWYRSQPLPSFGDKTAESLVSEGRAEALKRYLDRIADGGHS